MDAPANPKSVFGSHYYNLVVHMALENGRVLCSFRFILSLKLMEELDCDEVWN